uniref:Gamma-aminobutyric acid receptor subunit beta n=1 Tax=Meloidogyne javanica TaxID=6303 RepID=A0A915MIV6_MELJA
AISGTSKIINSKPKEYLNEESLENKIGKRKQRENIKNNNNIHPTVGVYDTNLETNMTRILNALIASHDRRIRPNFGGPPTIVNVTIHVITISAISEVSMDYTLDLYLRQFWHDSRLAFSGILAHQNLTVGIDMVKSIWTPDTFFPNEKKSYFHETTSHNSFLRIDSNGNVLRSIRLTVTANCPMSLHTFPLDKQVCPLEIEVCLIKN